MQHKLADAICLPVDFDAGQLAQSQVAILCSGGVESAALVHVLQQLCRRVHPLYMQFGLAWETVEQAHLRAFLSALTGTAAKVAELKVLAMPMTDAYAQHWSVTGKHVPDAQTPDAAVYLPGRNLMLLAKASVWCTLNQVEAVALGSLASNPFPDASPEFVSNMERVSAQAVSNRVRYLRPFSALHKPEVIKLVSELPMHLTMSCLQPLAGASDLYRHCGACNKCQERRQAFAQADVPDQTEYASLVPA